MATVSDNLWDDVDEEPLESTPLPASNFETSTIERIARIVAGGSGGHDPEFPVYRSSWYITKFFRDAGLPQYEHDGTTRISWIEGVLLGLSRADLEKIIIRLATRREYDSDALWERAIALVNEALADEDLRIAGTQRHPALEATPPNDRPINPPAARTPDLSATVSVPQRNGKDIFVVHGRNINARNSMFDFLRALGLNPVEWEAAVALTGSATPYTGHVIETAIKRADAVIVLVTPEDEAALLPEFQKHDDPDYEKNLTAQARPNVLFEAGMAFGILPDKTFILEFVTRPLRPFSDIAGRNVIRFDGSAAARNKVANRLRAVNIEISVAGSDWLRNDIFAEVFP